VQYYCRGTYFFLDDSLPATRLNDNSQLTLLNSRLGSRFSLTFASGEKGMHTGALGFDFDEFTEMLIKVETESTGSCFRTANLSSGCKYLKNQTMRFGMTSMQLEGEGEEGLKVTVTIISPFTPSFSLDESDKIKTQIAPVFYILIEVKNTSGRKVSGNIKVENILKRSSASPEEKWVAALSFHNDLANSFVLLDEKDNPRFYVLEG
jgi:hypothetical protein